MYSIRLEASTPSRLKGGHFREHRISVTQAVYWELVCGLWKSDTKMVPPRHDRNEAYVLP